jgi:two-component system nitrogen regulation response regulator GlnG
LGDAGWETSTFADAESALAVLPDSPPDLIVTDVQLPGINGDELVSQLRDDTNFNDLPIILMSAHREPRAHRADAFLPKPFDIEDVQALASRVTRARPG